MEYKNAVMLELYWQAKTKSLREEVTPVQFIHHISCIDWPGIEPVKTPCRQMQFWTFKGGALTI
jgi:hypothetical protein